MYQYLLSPQPVVLSISKIQFKSNSQLFRRHVSLWSRCAQYFKDTIQKQFTTDLLRSEPNFLLCSVFQRYNSKAIHNRVPFAPSCSSVVLSISKIQFKSNSQRMMQGKGDPRRCAQYFKDTIQKQFTTGLWKGCVNRKLCSVFQRYNSKAIHNSSLRSHLGLSVVLSISKIQFKSNSQRESDLSSFGRCCAQYFKDTIQKQFTTARDSYIRSFQVVLSISKIQFKSNSQLRMPC